jgi:hypothetical protein
MNMSDQLYSEWLKDQPPMIQRLADEFPIGSGAPVDGQILFVTGWNESGTVFCSTVPPNAKDRKDETVRGYHYAIVRQAKGGRADIDDPQGIQAMQRERQHNRTGLK